MVNIRGPWSCWGPLEPLQGPLDVPGSVMERRCCVQSSVDEEANSVVRGPLVPSRLWGGPQYNGAARGTALDNSAQCDTISFLWPTAPTLPVRRHFSGAAQQQFSALYKSAHTAIEGRPSWMQTHVIIWPLASRFWAMWDDWSCGEVPACTLTFNKIWTASTISSEFLETMIDNRQDTTSW